MRSLAIQIVSFCLLTAAGCDLSNQPGPVVPDHAVSPAGDERATPPALAVMATVNGKAIDMESIYRPLLQAHGLAVAEMLIADTLVEQEARRLKVTVTAEDVAAENDRSLQGIFGEQLSADQRERVLPGLLRRKGITRGLWDATMRRNAMLRKIVAPKVVVTEQMVKARFNALYGEKVQVSHIQLPSLAEAQKIIKMLEEGSDFATLARRHSTNTATADEGGALPPFSRHDPTIPQAIRQAAFALAENGISGIVQVENSFHVLKLHKRIAPPAANYETVKERLRRDLRRRIIERMQTETLSELRRGAQVEYVNPVLRRAANGPGGR